MTNDVSVFGKAGGSLDLSALAEKAHQAAQDSPRGGAPNGSDYLNFSGKTGRYSIGQDKRAINPDELWVLDVTSFESGWICWKDSTPKAQRMANIYSAPPVPEPDQDEFGPFDSSRGEGWSKAKGFVAKSLDNGQQGYFKNNSISGVSSISELQEAFASRAGSGEAAWPVFAFDIEQFTAQGFKNFKPVFKIAGWLDDDGMAALTSGGEYILDELFAAAAATTPSLAVDKPARKRS